MLDRDVMSDGLESTLPPGDYETPPADETDVLDSYRAGGLVMRGAVLRILGYGAGAGLALVSAIVLTRYLGVRRFGQYTTIISVATLATSVTDAGLWSLATREYAASVESERRQLMRDLFGLRVALTFLAVLAATVFAVAAGYDPTRIAATALAAVGLAIATIQLFLAVPLMTSLRLGWVSAIELIRQAVLVGLLVLLVLIGAGLLPLLAALVPSSLVALVVTLRLSRGAMPTRPSLRADRVFPLVRATIVFSLATGVGTVYAFAAQILTSLVTTPHQTGLFAAAFRLFSVVATAAGLLISSAFPLLARAARDDRLRLAFALQKMFEVAVILGFAAAISAVAGAAPIIAVVAGSHYAASTAVLRVEAAALLASFVLAALGYSLISLRRHGPLLAANGAALLVTGIVTLTLAASHGARGAAVGIVAGEWTLATGYMVALRRTDPELLPRLRTVVKILVAAGPAFAVIALGLPGGWQMLLSLVAYAVGLIVLRAIPRELLELLPRKALGTRMQA